MTTRGCSDTSGQGLLEFAMVLPIFLLLVLGVVETGYAMLEQHVVTKVSREGSNLISRDTPLGEAAAVMRSLATRPIDFDGNDSRLILTVVRRGMTAGTPNFDKDVVYQRHQIGGLPVGSKLTTRGALALGGGPDYTALNPDHDVNLQLMNLPATVVLAPGGMVYITEVYSTYSPLTPLERFGFSLPETLYSIAYF